MVLSAVFQAHGQHRHVRAGADRGRGTDHRHGGRAEPPRRRRAAVRVHVAGRQLQQLRRGRRDRRRHDRRGHGRGGRPDLLVHQAAGQDRAAAGHHVHHRAARRAVLDRHRRRLPGAHPAGRRGVPVPRPAPAGRARGRLRRCRRRVRGEHPHHPGRRDALGDHQRGHRRPRQPRLDHRQPVLRDRLHAAGHRRRHPAHGEVRRAPAGRLPPVGGPETADEPRRRASSAPRRRTVCGGRSGASSARPPSCSRSRSRRTPCCATPRPAA